MAKPNPTDAMPFTPPPKSTSTLEYHEGSAPLTGNPSDHSPSISSASESEPEAEPETPRKPTILSQIKGLTIGKGKDTAETKPPEHVASIPKKSASDNFGVMSISELPREPRERSLSPTDELLQEDDLDSFLVAVQRDLQRREKGDGKEERLEKMRDDLDELDAVRAQREEKEDKRREEEEDAYAEMMMRREGRKGKSEVGDDGKKDGKDDNDGDSKQEVEVSNKGKSAFKNDKTEGEATK